ncbi:MAG: amidohydrolase [Verrucomicrobiales bacterium]|jgi:amidohydrolase
MRRILLSLLLISGPAIGQEVQLETTANETRAIEAWVDSHLEEVVETYKHLHANPELSFQELKTSAFVAKSLEAAGFEVTSGVGRTGVVGVLKNGAGPTVLIRGDMDALPVLEQTGLPYASKVQVKKADGTTVGVMQACGHDVHTTMVVSMGQLLADLRENWKGTVVMIAQPAEEIGMGSREMIADGLFDLIPKPDFCLSLHVIHKLPVGSVGLTSGWAFANVDSVDVTIYGKGGHGARPNAAIDPIVTAAHVIVGLQTIVSRRLDPIEPGVITVGSIHGGSKHNIIPAEVKLQLTVRSYTDEVRAQLLDGIRQVTTDTCKTMLCPKPPLVEVRDEFTPAAYNDPALTAAAAELFQDLFGKENVHDMPPTMGGEDFGRFSKQLGVPGLQFRIGAVGLDRWEAAQKEGVDSLPSLHSPLFYPEPEKTMEVSLVSMANLALGLLNPAR